MAKESVKARQRKREKMVAKYAAKRAALKAAGDYAGLDKLPKNSSAVRLKNRCQLTGRPRGYMRYFGVCRLCSAIWLWMARYQVFVKQAGKLIRTGGKKFQSQE